MAKLEKKNFNTPDKNMTSAHAKMEIINIDGKSIVKSTFQPGWKWSVDIKPMAGTDVCSMHHLGYVISGTLHIVGQDGTEIEAVAGDVVDIPPGHDAWVVGDEDAVLVDFGSFVS